MLVAFLEILYIWSVCGRPQAVKGPGHHFLIMHPDWPYVCGQCNQQWINCGTEAFPTPTITICTDLLQQRGKKRFRLRTDTHQKAEGLMASGGLNRCMAGQPRTLPSPLMVLLANC